MAFPTESLDELRNQSRDLDTGAFLAWALATFGPSEPGVPSLAFATSLGLEDQLVLALLDERLADDPAPSGRVHAFTLDTGRLPEETLTVLHTNRTTFRVPVAVYHPEASAVEALISRGGPNLFYNSVEDRKACCAVRKVAPLGRALAGRRAWITGLRRAQSVTRTDLQRVEWDSANGLFKLNPLLDWSLDQVQAELVRRGTPVNTLHAQGYPSLGCAPCTRAVAPGEDERAGRWWWEQADKKECGLHADPTAPAPARSFKFGGLS
jgi:phosphoadenosine phosphosulfate reductase